MELVRQPTKALKQLTSQLGVAKAILSLAPSIFSGDEKALSDTKQILEHAPLLSLAGLERAFRSTTAHKRVKLSFQETTPSNLALLTDLKANRSLALGLASSSRDGYIREAATKALATELDFHANAFLLLRLNDYIWQNQYAAEQALAERILLLSPKEILELLPLLMQAKNLIRSSHIQVVDRYIERLKSYPQSLERGIEHSDETVRQHTYHLLLEKKMENEELAGLFRKALCDPSPIIRLWAGQRVMDRHQTPTEVVYWMLSFLEESPSQNLRLAALIKNRKLESWNKILTAAFDHHAKVRFRARSYLGKTKRFVDYRQQALDRLTQESLNTNQLIGALATLSDFAIEQDRMLIEPFAKDKRTRVRKEAKRTLSLIP